MCANAGLGVLRRWGNEKELGWQQGRAKVTAELEGVGWAMKSCPLVSSASWEVRVEAQVHEALLQIQRDLSGEIV